MLTKIEFVPETWFVPGMPLAENEGGSMVILPEGRAVQFGNFAARRPCFTGRWLGHGFWRVLATPAGAWETWGLFPVVSLRSTIG